MGDRDSCTSLPWFEWLSVRNWVWATNQPLSMRSSLAWKLDRLDGAYAGLLSSAFAHWVQAMNGLLQSKSDEGSPILRGSAHRRGALAGKGRKKPGLLAEH